MAEPGERRRLALAVRERRFEVADEVTDEFLRRHPDWTERYGHRARTEGVQDAAFHTDFLAGALALGREDSFADYGAWLARVLAARGIAQEFAAENLRQVGEAVANRFPDHAAAILRTAETGARACESAGASTREAYAGQAATVFRDAALAGERERCLQVVREAAASGLGLLEVYAEIIEPVQRSVGELWEANEVTVAQEHMVTAISEYALSVAASESEPGQAFRGAVVICGVAGEAHRLGPMMVANALEADGWRVRFLGTDIPTAAVLGAIADVDPDIVGVSATTTANATASIDLVGAVRGRFGPTRPKICLGGKLFRDWPELADELEADGTAADVRGAVDWARAAARG